MTISGKPGWQPHLENFEGPRYRALADAIEQAIEQGELAADTRLPPQRQLADTLGVTVGTVTRGYAEAERRGLVSARVGSGTYINDPDRAGGQSFLSSEAATRSDAVDLTLSLPVPNAMREQVLGQILQDMAQQPAALTASVAYQPELGQTQAREQFAHWLQGHGLPLDADELMVVQGGQHGVYLALQMLVRNGETLLSDALTYPGLIAAARLLGLRHLGVPMDEQGIVPEALDKLCRQHRPRALYLSPELNNPTTAFMSDERRQAIVALAREHDFWLIEDGVQFLPAADRGTPLFELAPERTVFIFSTSKALGGGLRVGILRAPSRIRDSLGAALKAHCWAVPGLPVAAVCNWLASGKANQLVHWQWQELAARQALVRRYLGDYGARARDHAGLVWLPMPEDWRAAEFVRAARSKGIIVLPAEPFCAGNQPAAQAVRLSISSPASQAELEQALKVLADVLASPNLPAWQPL